MRSKPNKPNLDTMYAFRRTGGMVVSRVARIPRRAHGFVPSAALILLKTESLRGEHPVQGQPRVPWLPPPRADEGKSLSTISLKLDCFGHYHGAFSAHSRVLGPHHPRADIQRFLAQIFPIQAIKYGMSGARSPAASRRLCRGASVQRIGFGRRLVRGLRIVVVRFSAKPRIILAPRVADQASIRRRRYTLSDENAASQYPEISVRIRPPPATSSQIAIDPKQMLLGLSRRLRSQPLAWLSSYDQIARLITPGQKEYYHEGCENLVG